LQFTRLKIAGFKSFVEAVEFEIFPGLTGIIGPNGCGKSNLVEALRWVMGEASPKNVRGGDMEDVIFAGSAHRPGRNLAEVRVTMDNSTRKAPALYNDADEIEVIRRIERGQGSLFLINGREARARDVQLLFADMATGAHATAIVGQGRIGALISARPADRRLLLEESAGITGLHSRRHEAELKLSAAEQNLARVDEILGELELQLQGLKRQARQASRYRNISGYLRKAEALRFHVLHMQASRELGRNEAELAEAEADVAWRTSLLAKAQTAETDAGQKLPPLRQAEAEAAGAWHRLALERDRLQTEETRAQEALERLGERLNQIAADQAREKDFADEAGAALARLGLEERELRAQMAGKDPLAELQARVEREALAAGDVREKLDRLTEKIGQAQAKRAGIEASLAAAKADIERQHARLRDIAEELAKIDGEAAESARKAGQDKADEARARWAQAREETAAAERRRLSLQAEEENIRQSLQRAQAQLSGLRAEEAGLTKLVGKPADPGLPPLIDSVRVQPGYEKALAAAFGDDLSAAADVRAPIHWADLGPFSDPLPLPAGAEPLAQFVKAPPALAHRLSQIGVISQSLGPGLRAKLRQGQRLVSREGALWRWDGFTVHADAAHPASLRLQHRHRLTEIGSLIAALVRKIAAEETRLALAEDALRHAREAETKSRQALQAAEAALSLAREQAVEAAQAAATLKARAAALAEAEARVKLACQEAETRNDDFSRQLSLLPEANAEKEALDLLRREDATRLAALADARAALDRHHQRGQERELRLAAIGQESRAWALRADANRRQLAELQARAAKAEAEREALKRLPAQIAQARSALFERLTSADSARCETADRLAQAENDLAQLRKSVRAAADELGEARERRAAKLAALDHAKTALAELIHTIRLGLECAPEGLLALADTDIEAPLPELGAIEQRIERLKRERDTMGPVNLRADIEAQEIEARARALASDRTDLLGAIERLRQAINKLNGEGRERLMAAFQHVDRHFQELFQRLFGGGRAHLALTESEDPLAAGLEIMASPPGKRLQVLSLLSGGEQALTAIALLFAVFLTNPAPICVLDEVDAPLDDANVDRFCDLLADLARNTETRFLVITHHPITMSRVDRLFGVTMGERGVSSLVSVDLAEAEALRASA
jgi:chromosome segregation protein